MQQCILKVIATDLHGKFVFHFQKLSTKKNGWVINSQRKTNELAN